MKTEFSVDLPQWAIEKQSKLPKYLSTAEDRMRAVISFSRENIKQQTGGPFAAGVFEKETGKIVVIGVNRVMPTNISSAHAEVVAISLAQSYLNTFDLGQEGLPDYELVVNWRPCIMCMGALIWSGIKYLTIAGDGPELEEITGFDEGPVSSNWVEQLADRQIHVTNNMLTQEAVAVFEEFRKNGCYVYNASRK